MVGLFFVNVIFRVVMPSSIVQVPEMISEPSLSEPDQTVVPEGSSTLLKYVLLWVLQEMEITLMVSRDPTSLVMVQVTTGLLFSIAGGLRVNVPVVQRADVIVTEGRLDEETVAPPSLASLAVAAVIVFVTVFEVVNVFWQNMEAPGARLGAETPPHRKVPMLGMLDVMV